jgi:hypothetical protein
MATTESRPGFRLPWSADRASSHDGFEDVTDVASLAVADPGPAPDDAVDTGALPDATNVAAAQAAATDDQPAEAPAPTPPTTSTAAPGGAPGPGRRPTTFLLDMTHAMQAAAEQARAATLEQFRVDGAAYVELIQGRSAADTEALRRRAEGDIASIKDWSKAEIARIREETETRVSGRRGQLDEQLSRHAALVERDVARIEAQIASFEAEMAAFFDELLAETDLTVLAARAQQMPEAPDFDQLDETAFTELMNEPAVGVPVTPAAAEPEPVAAQAGPSGAGLAEAAASVAGTTAEASADADETTASTIPPAANEPLNREAAMAAIPAAAEAAAAAAAAEAAETAGDTSADTIRGSRDTAADDPRLAMLGLTPDFEAAEAAAAEAAAAEVSEIPEFDEENLVARLAGLVPTATHEAPTDPSTVTDAATTRVIVTGLISVASIASFKRHLSRYPGMRHVGVSSGPDGEFLFLVQHDPGVSLRDVIPTLPGFQARITGDDDGVVTVSARDPED